MTDISQNSQLDVNVLNWVKGEIDETITQARAALEAYVENPDDDSQLRFCVNYVHQVHGTLQMVELYGAALVAEEMEKLTQGIIDNTISSNKDDAFEILLRGMMQLPVYLERLLGGEKDMPMVLLPLLNDLRAARGEILLSENALFKPDLAIDAPQTHSLVDEEGADIQKLARKLRHSYHLGLLAWYRESAVEAGLNRIAKIISQLRDAAKESETNRMLWVASGVVEGLSQGGLESSVTVKLLLGKLDHSIKRIIDKGEIELTNNPPSDLIKNLLYYVSCADSKGEIVTELKSAFKLKDVMPDIQTLEQARVDLAGPDAALMQTVSAALMDDLTQIKDNLDIFVRSEQRDVNDLKSVNQTLIQMADTLGMLSLGIERSTVLEKIDILNQMISGKCDIEESVLMDIAGALLVVETSLRDIGNRQGIEDKLEQAAADTIERLFNNAERRKLLKSVVDEAKVDLASVKQALSDYSHSLTEHDLLTHVPKALSQIQGGLSILSLHEAADLLGYCNAYIQKTLLEDKTIPEVGDLEKLADAISSIEYFLESVAERWGVPRAILEVARQSLEQLGYGETSDLSSSDTNKALENLSEDSSDITKSVVNPFEDNGSTKIIELDGSDMFEAGVVSADDLSAIDELPDTEGLESTKKKPPDEAGDNGPFDEIDIEPISLVDEATLEGRDDTDPNEAEVLNLDLPASTQKTSVEKLGEMFNLWCNNHSDSGITEQFRDLLKHITAQAKVEKLNKVIKIASDMEAIVNRIAEGKDALNEDIKNTLRWAADTLVGLFEGTEEIKYLSDDATGEILLQGLSPQISQTIEVKSQSSIESNSINEEIDDEIIDIFLEEGQQEYDNISRLLSDWKASPNNEEALREIRRSFHTLKGSGRLVGALDIGEFAWSFENLLNRVIDRTVSASPVMFELLDHARQVLPNLFELFKENVKPEREIFILMDYARDLSQDKKIDLESLKLQEFEVSSDAQQVSTIEPSLLEVYLAETETHLTALHEYIQEWNAGSHEITQTLLRTIHTLLGSSRAAGIEPAIELFDPIEKLTVRLEENNLQLDSSVLEFLQESADYVENIMQWLRDPGVELQDSHSLLKRIQSSYDNILDELSVPKEVKVPKELPLGEIVEPAREYDEELLVIFIEEGTEILDECDHLLHDWRQDQDGPEFLEAMQRQLHTLKGGARMAGITEIGDLSHSIESVLTAIVNGAAAVSPKMFKTLQQAQDNLVNMLEQVKNNQALVPVDDMINNVLELLQGDAQSEEVVDEVQGDQSAAQEIEVELTELAEQPEVGIESEIDATSDDDNVIPLQTVLGTHTETLEQSPQEVVEKIVEPTRPVRLRGGQLRVRADLLDNMVNFAGEVNIYQSRMEQQINTFRYNMVEYDDIVKRLRDQLRRFEFETETQSKGRYEKVDGEVEPQEAERLVQIQQLSQGMLESLTDLDSLSGILKNLTRESETLLSQQSRVSTELQDGLVRTRMVPFSGQVPRLQRIVRQTCDELHKQTELIIQGADTTLDRTVLERIMAPIEHMLRNSVAHGIEKTEDREKVGKSNKGTIKLSLHHEESDIVIEVSDDGGGIDLESIRAKAIKQGMISADAKVSKDVLLDMIMESGFSTATEITQIAGRGVGMDVVDSEIKQLGGLLNITTEPKKGTTFTVRLPLTLAHARALIVNLGEEIYAVPLIGIEGVERISKKELKQLRKGDKPIYQWGGRDYQFISLSNILEIKEQPPTRRGQRIPLLLVHSGEYRVAIQVDGLMGSREIVVKPVGPQLSTLRGISGATIMGDGSVVLIMDLGVLIRLIMGPEMQTVHQERSPDTPDPEVFLDHAPSVLIADDSMTVRKVTSRLLKRHDMNVVTAKDGVDTLAQLHQRKPDVVLLDIAMKHMDGFEVISSIREDEQLKDLPIVLITSHDTQENRERASQVGVHALLKKPYKETELLETIQEIIQESAVQAPEVTETASVETIEARPTDYVPTVMVVDDSITVRRMTERFLERNNLAAVTARDGVDALTQLQEKKPDVILLDVEMPRMDGFELTVSIRNDEQLKDIPIVMITSRTGKKHRDHALDLGVNVFMDKPYIENELLVTIKQLLPK